MATSKTSTNIMALGAMQQTNYQTDLDLGAAPKVYRQIEKSDRQLAKYSVAGDDNKGNSTGVPYATRRNRKTHDVSFSLTEDMSSQLLPERAKAGMGICETIELVAGAAFEHTLKLLNPQDESQLPAIPYVEKAGESVSRPDAHDVKYPSAVCGNFGIQGQGIGILQSQTQWVGSGKRISPSDVTFYDPGSQVILLEDMLRNFFRHTTGKFNLFPEANLGGVAFEVQCNFRDFNFAVNNNLKAESGYYGCGLVQDDADKESGAIRGKCEIGDPQVTFSFTMIMDDAYNAAEKMKDMESISAELIYEGSTIIAAHKHAAFIKLLSGMITDVEYTDLDGDNGVSITTEPLSIGSVMPVEIVVVNDVESYTTPSW